VVRDEEMLGWGQGRGDIGGGGGEVNRL